MIMVPAKYPEPVHPFDDDGWWASIMAEEESRGSPSVPRPVKIEEKKTEETKKTVEEIKKPSPDWEQAKSVFCQDGIITLKVTSHNKGGLLVEGDGLSGFVPCSHLVDLPLFPDESNREECLSAYVGRTIRLKIIECEPDESRLIFSERAARSEAGKRPVLFSTIRAGQKIQGNVTNVTEFGVFVDLGGVEGLIHISELSWGRVSHPSSICKVGQHIDVLVMDVAPDRCRIALSLKRLMPNPWETAEQHYPVNSVVPAVVSAVASFGVFARLEEGLEGLIHTSEIPSSNSGLTKGGLTTGQSVQVRIIQVDAARQRLGLSLKLD